MVVIKRDGREADFDKGKIANAILKAFTEVEKLSAVGDKNEVSKKISTRLYNRYQRRNRAISVEEIQDDVETELMKDGEFVVAKAYIKYRYEHELLRNACNLQRLPIPNDLADENGTDKYNICLRTLRPLITDDEYKAIMTQYMCKLESDFLGFIDVYKPLSELIPKEKTIIDFGCYLAAQSYFFAKHKCYIGVDVVDMKRFTPPNAVHYISSIQNFIANEVPKLFQKHGEGHYCAICSYVPDFKATELVRQTFSNVFCYYP